MGKPPGSGIPWLRGRNNGGMSGKIWPRWVGWAIYSPGGRLWGLGHPGSVPWRNGRFTSC